MNSKMTRNSKLSTTEPKNQTQKQTKQTTRTGIESQKWTSHGGLSAVRGRGENVGKGRGSKKHKWYVENRERLRIVWETEKPKNLHACYMDMN